jgi:hypothetical protein
MTKVSGTSMTNNIPNPEDDGAFVLLDFSGDRLDPAPLVSMIPLTPVRPKRKGDPLGPSRGGRTPTAKTGYCGFSTMGKGLPKDGNAHVAFLLKTVSDRIIAIREIMSEQSLDWRATFFEGHSEGQMFSDLNPELTDRTARLGLPLLPNEEEAVTIVADLSQSEP